MKSHVILGTKWMANVKKLTFFPQYHFHLISHYISSA